MDTLSVLPWLLLPVLWGAMYLGPTLLIAISRRVHGKAKAKWITRSLVPLVGLPMGLFVVARMTGQTDFTVGTAFTFTLWLALPLGWAIFVWYVLEIRKSGGAPTTGPEA